MSIPVVDPVPAGATQRNSTIWVYSQAGTIATEQADWPGYVHVDVGGWGYFGPEIAPEALLRYDSIILKPRPIRDEVHATTSYMALDGFYDLAVVSRPAANPEDAAVSSASFLFCGSEGPTLERGAVARRHLT